MYSYVFLHKFILTFFLDGYTVLVRGCSVDAGGTNSDTELGRETHCWIVEEVRWGDLKMKGCSNACNTDGCNGGHRIETSGTTLMILVILGWVILI